MNVNPFSYLIEKLKSKADKTEIPTKIEGFNIPVCIEKNTSVETWMSVSFPVSVGDRVCWSGMSTANSGAFTVDVSGSISGVIASEARNHVSYNTIAPIYNLDIHTDETLTITSYTNTATTFKHMNISVYKLGS